MKLSSLEKYIKYKIYKYIKHWNTDALTTLMLQQVEVQFSFQIILVRIHEQVISEQIWLLCLFQSKISKKLFKIFLFVSQYQRVSHLQTLKTVKVKPSEKLKSVFVLIQTVCHFHSSDYFDFSLTCEQISRLNSLLLQDSLQTNKPHFHFGSSNLSLIFKLSADFLTKLLRPFQAGG